MVSGKTLLVAVVLVAALAAASAQPPPPALQSNEHKKGGAAHGGAAHHVPYDKSGSDWEGTCKEGVRQSPINIVYEDVKLLAAEPPAPGRDDYKLSFHYKAHPMLTMKHNGHSVQVDGDLGYVTAGKAQDKYLVKQFHFHTPSEHRLEGLAADLELHIVHQKEGATEKNDLLVVGVMFQSLDASTPDSPFLTSLDWNLVPSANGKEHHIKSPVDLNLLMPVLKGDYYGYAGSLTTPPCSETVSWRLIRTVQHISPAQHEKIAKVFPQNPAFAKLHGNERAPQPVNGREVVLFKQAKTA